MTVAAGEADPPQSSPHRPVVPADPPAAPAKDLERRLSAVLSEFARTLVTDFPIQAILDHLVQRIVHVLPISGAGVSLISPGTDPRYVAASDTAALRFVQLQGELGEGPCLAAYETGAAVSVPDLRADHRFVRFGPPALEAGLVAVFSFPLCDGDERLGALDLYRATPGALDAEAMAAAQTLADVAAAYLLNAQARVDLREATELARSTSLHDGLTGLPNRTLLLERIERALLRSPRTGKFVAVLFADVDQFKAVNDTLGHHVGDALLVAVAQRLTLLLRPSDTLARLAGDEFVILCEDLDARRHVQPIADRVVAALGAPFHLVGHDVHVTGSVGVAFATESEDIPEQVLKDADTAMYQAKRQGGNRRAILDRREQRITDRTLKLRSDLRGALPRRELKLDYQPIVATADGRITGAEALLRWIHPTHGLLDPATVIPIAEQTGLMVPIGLWVLEQACRDRRRWPRPVDGDVLQVAVNVSVVQLMRPGFVVAVAGVLATTDTAPGSVTLEITESCFIDDGEQALLVLDELKHLGVKLALDDFGTGYSALSLLKRFPVDILKIDRQFVVDVEHDPASIAIVRSVVALAHGLGMAVIAEGVESVGQYEQLVSLDCESCQGFYLARPAPAADIEAMLGESGFATPVLPLH